MVFVKPTCLSAAPNSCPVLLPQLPQTWEDESLEYPPTGSPILFLSACSSFAIFIHISCSIDNSYPLGYVYYFANDNVSGMNPFTRGNIQHLQGHPYQ